jgi:hypothetical protein
VLDVLQSAPYIFGLRFIAYVATVEQHRLRLRCTAVVGGSTSTQCRTRRGLPTKVRAPGI